MGSVAVLTTSGDNAPELYPVQSYRHYLYCDACGSFDLEPWETVDRAEMDRRRRRLARVALWAPPLLAVPAWEATGIAFHLSFLWSVRQESVQRTLEAQLEIAQLAGVR